MLLFNEFPVGSADHLPAKPDIVMVVQQVKINPLLIDGGYRA
jgi:hypothetical protein